MLYLSCSGENMNNNLIELIVKLGTFEDLSNKNIYEILNLLKEYFSAKNCVWKRTNRSDGIYFLNEYNSNNSLYLFLSDDYFNDVIIIHDYKINIDSYLESYVAIKTILSKLVLIDRLIERANTDSLTKVLNSNALEDKISKKYFENTGVSFIDVNGLGIVNNKYGHEAGDEMLKVVAKTIQSVFRKKDVFRKSGDEFIVICENIEEKLFRSKLELAKQLILEAGYSASFGIVYAKKVDDIKVLIKLADEKMYVEKEEYRRLNPSKYSIIK